MGIVQKDGNLKRGFQRMYQLIDTLIDHFKVVQDPETFGYVTLSPALVGTGFKIFVYIKLPYLGLEETFRQDILDQYDMECEQSKHSLVENLVFVISNKRTFGLSESEILSSMYRCLKEIIIIENRCREATTTTSTKNDV
jgi:protein-arginine kinase